MDAPKNAEVAPIDEWNTTRIIVKGPHVEHWLNGIKWWNTNSGPRNGKSSKHMASGQTPFYGMSKTGHIGLQDHGGLTMFRNMKIREL